MKKRVYFQAGNEGGFTTGIFFRAFDLIKFIEECEKKFDFNVSGFKIEDNNIELITDRRPEEWKK